MEEEKLITLKDVATALELGETTVRYYRDNYGEFLPAVQTEGMQHPKYKEITIEIIKEIRQLSNEGKTKHDIKIELSKKYQPVYTGLIVQEPAEPNNQQMSQLIQIVKTIAPDQQELERLRIENQIIKTLYLQEKKKNLNIQKQLSAPPKKSLFERLKFW